MLKALLVVILILAVAVAVAMAYGASRWKSDTVRLRERLERARSPVRPRVVGFRGIEGLPAPVQRYFRTVLVEGRRPEGARPYWRGRITRTEYEFAE